MPTNELSEITKVDVRDIWSNEAQDFTPWIAENLSVLGKELGMDLELLSTEAPVGSFSLDILARDVSRSVTVVIENQLTNTNHDHLGKLLTYAAGHDARSVIWLTREFRDEHRQALDWLNQRTDDSTEFYGVEVEVFKIDESAPAPHFKVVASPNNWSKQTKTDTSHNLSPKAKKYRSFFQQLIDELRDVHHFTAAKIGQPNSYYYFSGGNTAIKYGASFVLSSNVRIELNIDGDKESNKRLFDNLEEIKSEL